MENKEINISIPILTITAIIALTVAFCMLIYYVNKLDIEKEKTKQIELQLQLNENKE